MSHLHRMLSASLLTVGLLLAGSWSASSAHAQGKAILQLPNVANKMINLQPLQANPKLFQPLRGKMLALSQAGRAENAQALDDFDTYVLGRIAELTWMTGVNPEVKRMNIKRELRQFSLGAVQDLHDRLNQTLLLNLPALAADSAVNLDARYNALLLLGQLDRVEPNAAGGVAAVPLAEATNVLVKAFDTESLAESLRIGALVGLARQSELQVVAGVRPPLAAVAIRVIASKSPLPGFTPNGHHWARHLASQLIVGLSKTGSEVNRPEVVKALHDVIADPNEPLFVRRDAALALGHIDPNVLATGQAKPADLVKALSSLTLEITRAGAARPADAGEPTLTKAYDVFPTPSEDKDIKRNFTDGLSYYLNCVATALGGRSNRGLRSLSSDPNAALANELVVTFIDPIVTSLGRSNIVATQIPIDLADRHTKLSAWIADKKLVGAPPAPAPVAAPAPAAK